MGVYLPLSLSSLNLPLRKQWVYISSSGLQIFPSLPTLEVVMSWHWGFWRLEYLLETSMAQRLELESWKHALLWVIIWVVNPQPCLRSAIVNQHQLVYPIIDTSPVTWLVVNYKDTNSSRSSRSYKLLNTNNEESKTRLEIECLVFFELFSKDIVLSSSTKIDTKNEMFEYGYYSTIHDN